MFKKVLHKLTALNSVVFLILSIIFCSILYGYVSYRLFDKIDEAMWHRASSFRIVNGRITPLGKKRSVYDPRIFILLKDTSGKVINIFPVQNDEIDDAMAVAFKIDTGELRTIDFEDHTYRALSVPYQYEEKLLTINNEAITISEVIAVSIVDSEVALLNNLMKIFITGLVLGTTIILLTGFLLARRALVPITEAWEKQQQFVADASHELRSPLTVIKTNAELMLRRPEHTVEEESKRISNILREVMRMTKLVSTLLTLARADANQMEIQLAPVVLNDIVDTVREQFSCLADFKGIAFKVEAANRLVLSADRERLHQLLVILLDNAIKYTPAQGAITLRCYEKSNVINIEVIDTGRGISTEDLPHIFDRFYRGDKSRARETGGTGLGLAIAQWIIDKHGGKIKVESELGIGTKFHIWIPIIK